VPPTSRRGGRSVFLFLLRAAVRELRSRRGSLQYKRADPTATTDNDRKLRSRSCLSSIDRQRKMNPTAPLPLPESAKRFWRHLVPVALFPSFAIVLLSRKQDAWAVWLMYGAFFASGFYAMWPTFRGRAKYSFWMLACSLYLGGGLLAIPVGLVFKALFDSPAR